MDVYLYCAALYCSHCGEAIKHERHEYEPLDVEDESSFDSDYYPKGPYGDGGGEADSPQHCDSCTVFLENPLTGDGEEYTRAQWEEYVTTGVGNPAVLFDWLSCYDWLWRDFKDTLSPEQLEVAEYLESAQWAA